MKTIKVLVVLAFVSFVAGAGILYSGLYNMGADQAHWPVTLKLIETLRERSVSAHAKGIEVPKLDDAKLIAEGAEHYSAMCSGCHLAPGMEDTEIRVGLYPRPPKLAAHARGESHTGMDAQAMAARQFWIIKHGIKMTAMPAWGTGHDDDSIWGLVAFVQKLPGMTPEEYAALTGKAGGHLQSDAHSHGAAEVDGHTGNLHGAEAAPSDSIPADHVDAPDTPPHSHGEDKKSASAPSEPRAIAETFNRAFAMGDAGTVRALLQQDVLIYESGGAETSAAEYADHHMPADMAFLSNLKRKQLSQESGGEGVMAWVATRSRLSGPFKGKDMDLDSTETLVMTKTEAGWRIAHIHWSSAPHRNSNP